MKKIFVYMASAALMFAVACNKEEVNVDTPETPDTVETEIITVDLNPMTKTALGADDTTTWDADDEVSVTVGGNDVGTLKLVEGTSSTFSGAITAGLSGAAVLNYPAGVTSVPATQVAKAGSFADGAALLEGSTTVENLRAGNGVELQNMTALLEFSVAQAGDVTFEVGTAKYTVTDCKTEGTYYACVEPAENVSFVARIDGYFSKKASKNVTFTANKISGLGELPAPVPSEWVVKGIDNWTKDAEMYVEGNWYVARNVSSSTFEYKFNKGGDSGTWIGAKGSFVHGEYAYSEGGDNIKVSKSNTLYDFYYCAEGGMYMILPAGTSIDAIEVKTDMYLRGGCNNWGATAPTMHDGKFFGWKNLKFNSIPEFKFSTKTDAWDWQYSTESILNINQWVDLKAGDNNWGNTRFSTIGTYDIYTTSDKLNRNKVVIVKSGDPIPAL